MATPEARAALHDLAARRLKQALERMIARRPEGSRPVRLVATINRIDIPSAAQRILIGGHPTVQADIAIIDVHSGAVLTTYKGGIGTRLAGQGAMTAVDALMVSAGADDLFDRAANDYADRFQDWLAPR